MKLPYIIKQLVIPLAVAASSPTGLGSYGEGYIEYNLTLPSTFDAFSIVAYPPTYVFFDEINATYVSTGYSIALNQTGGIDRYKITCDDIEFNTDTDSVFFHFSGDYLSAYNNGVELEDTDTTFYVTLFSDHNIHDSDDGTMYTLDVTATKSSSSSSSSSLLYRSHPSSSGFHVVSNHSSIPTATYTTPTSHTLVSESKSSSLCQTATSTFADAAFKVESHSSIYGLAVGLVALLL